MEHFSTSDWADFVRDIGAFEKRTEITKHIGSGCLNCLRTSEIWKTVMEFARQEHLNDPPASALRIVQAYFGMLRQTPYVPDSIEIAKLAFDSFQRGLAGERGTSCSMPRQLLFKCGTFCVDVRIEPKPGSDYIVLVGQVIDAKRPLKGFDQVPVSLLSSGDKVTETTTNQFGEFHFGFQSVKQMQLFFGLQQKALVVPLPAGYSEAA